MENQQYHFYQPYERKTSKKKAFIALFAGIAILGMVAFVALSGESQSLRGNNLLERHTSEETKAYDDFLVKYRKTYLTPEENKGRFQIFVDNYRLIKESNEDKRNTYTLAVNEFADLTLEEFKLKKLGLNVPQDLNEGIFSTEYTLEKENENIVVGNDVDLRGTLPPIKSQGGCGSCWAFSAVGALESLYFLNGGSVINLSEQELVDCSREYGNNGCNGGWMDNAFKYVMDHGIHLGSQYIYQGSDLPCISNDLGSPAFQPKSFVRVAENDNDALRIAVAGRPVSITVNAGSHGWIFYKSGILNANCGTVVDHGVLIVGYGSENGQDYWLVRNSWGAGWGEGGYVRVARTSGINPGVCGIAQHASFPIIG